MFELTDGDSGGAKLRELRRRAGLSQLKVEHRAGIGTGKLSRYERGKLKPRRETLRRILAALDAKHNERQAVFESFGYHVGHPLPDEKDIQWACQICRPILDAVQLPAYLLDCATRLLLWNDYIPKLLGVPDDDHSLLRRIERKPLFQSFFDRATNLSGFIANAQEYFPENMKILKHELYPYRREPWVEPLLAETIDMYPPFEQLWAQVNDGKPAEIGGRPLVLLKFNVPGLGVHQFRIAEEHLTRDTRFRVIYYFPADVKTVQQLTTWTM
jgi:transcriptional regulator with XRE-family HTH domain